MFISRLFITYLLKNNFYVFIYLLIFLVSLVSLRHHFLSMSWFYYILTHLLTYLLLLRHVFVLVLLLTHSFTYLPFYYHFHFTSPCYVHVLVFYLLTHLLTYFFIITSILCHHVMSMSWFYYLLTHLLTYFL